MKFTKLILKVTAGVLLTAAGICLILAHMEKISDVLGSLWAKVQLKKDQLCRRSQVSAYDDEFENWDV